MVQGATTSTAAKSTVTASGVRRWAISHSAATGRNSSIAGRTSIATPTTSPAPIAIAAEPATSARSRDRFNNTTAASASVLYSASLNTYEQIQTSGGYTAAIAAAATPARGPADREAI